MFPNTGRKKYLLGGRHRYGGVNGQIGDCIRLICLNFLWSWHVEVQKEFLLGSRHRYGGVNGQTGNHIRLIFLKLFWPMHVYVKIFPNTGRKNSYLVAAIVMEALMARLEIVSGNFFYNFFGQCMFMCKYFSTPGWWQTSLWRR